MPPPSPEPRPAPVPVPFDDGTGDVGPRIAQVGQIVIGQRDVRRHLDGRLDRQLGMRVHRQHGRRDRRLRKLGQLALGRLHQLVRAAAAATTHRRTLGRDGTEGRDIDRRQLRLGRHRLGMHPRFDDEEDDQPDDGHVRAHRKRRRQRAALDPERIRHRHRHATSAPAAAASPAGTTLADPSATSATPAHPPPDSTSAARMIRFAVPSVAGCAVYCRDGVRCPVRGGVWLGEAVCGISVPFMRASTAGASDAGAASRLSAWRSWPSSFSILPLHSDWVVFATYDNFNLSVGRPLRSSAYRAVVCISLARSTFKARCR